MKPDGVSIAFELISDEIQYVAEGIAEQGAEAFKQLRHSDAKVLAESGESLQEFKQKLDALKDEWQASFDLEVRERINMSPLKPKEPQIKSSKTRLHIRFSDGIEFSDAVAADSFVKAIQRIGLQRVESLGLTLRGLPLVGDTKSKKYQQRRAEGRYVTIHSETKQKKNILDDIARNLNLNIKTTIIQ